MLPLLYPLFTGSAAVVALIGQDDAADPMRVYRHGSAPQGVMRPYVTWSVPGGAADNTFDGGDADVFRVHVDCWADGDDAIDALALAVRDALEPAAHLVAYLADERDFQTQRYRISYAFDFIEGR